MTKLGKDIIAILSFAWRYFNKHTQNNKLLEYNTNILPITAYIARTMPNNIINLSNIIKSPFHYYNLKNRANVTTTNNINPTIKVCIASMSLSLNFCLLLYFIILSNRIAYIAYI